MKPSLLLDKNPDLLNLLIKLYNSYGDGFFTSSDVRNDLNIYTFGYRVADYRAEKLIKKVGKIKYGVLGVWSLTPETIDYIKKQEGLNAPKTHTNKEPENENIYI
jgi:hypothetical protein